MASVRFFAARGLPDLGTVLAPQEGVEVARTGGAVQSPKGCGPFPPVLIFAPGGRGNLEFAKSFGQCEQVDLEVA